MTLSFLVILYLSFRLKQFTCDFLLQTEWMALTKSKPGKEGYKALLMHAGIHGIGTSLLMLIFAPGLLWLGALDFVLHALIDRLKGTFVRNKGWTPQDTGFWWSYGLDQEAHNITHMCYIIVIVMYTGGLVLAL